MNGMNDLNFKFIFLIISVEGADKRDEKDMSNTIYGRSESCDL